MGNLYKKRFREVQQTKFAHLSLQPAVGFGMTYKKIRRWDLLKMIPYKIPIVQTLHRRNKDRRIPVVVDWRISWNKILIFLTTCGLEMRSILISRGLLTNRSVECREQNIQTSTRCSIRQSGVFYKLLRSSHCGLVRSENSEQCGAFLEEYFFFIFIFQRTGCDFGSLDSVVGIATSCCCTVRRSNLGRGRIFFFLLQSRPYFLCDPPSLLFIEYRV